MTGRWVLPLVLVLGTVPAVVAHSTTAPSAPVDSRAEIAAALYAASATQAAAERVADGKLRAQRKEIEALRTQVRAGALQHQADLTAAEETYVAALAARDRAYAQEIAVFRAAVEDIAATPEGAAALARYNAGDEVGALAVLDELRAARDAARKKRADIESAVEGRRIATLALDARNKGKFTTAQVIARYEEVTRLDPGVHWDWIELGGLYQDAGNLSAALTSFRTAHAIAGHLVQADPGNIEWQHDLSASHERIANVQQMQGNLPAALASYRAAQAIDERLAQADPSNAERQRALALSHNKIGDVQDEQGNLLAALASYRAFHAILDRLVQADPSNAERQHDLAVSHNYIGNVQLKQSDLPAALASYRAGHAINERLAHADPSNTVRQHDLGVSHSKIGDLQVKQGDLPAALASYRAAQAIDKGLAQADAGNSVWQRALSVSHQRLGDVHMAQSDLPAALVNYRASHVIAERLAESDPGNAAWQRDLAISHYKIGHVQQTQGDRPAALASYRASHAIFDRLAQTDQSNAEWQRGLMVSYVMLNIVTGDKAYAAKALNIAERMQQGGTLAPSDMWMIEDLKRRAAP
jgi:tetratricopeptide (TPR) repeat protein